MSVLLTIGTVLLSLIWLGLMLINISGAILGKKESYSTRKLPGRVLVMVPCKGMEITLERNLQSLKEQDYPNYKLVAIIDDKSDAALPIIKKLGITYIFGSKKYKECSGKVRAIITAMEKYKNYDVYVNIDADAECESSHIRETVAPLSDKGVGVSTTYPYFEPVGGFWSVVKMTWGLVGLGMMESKLTRFVWGGTMAYRKDLIGPKELKIFKRAIVDDITIGYFAKTKGLGWAYFNKGTIKVPTDDNITRFFEWSTRQTMLTLLGNRKVLYYGLSFYGGQALLLVSGILLTVFVSPLYVLLLVPFIIGVAKTYERARHPYLSLFIVCLLINFIFIANLLIASRKKGHWVWRGKKYPLMNPF